MVASTHFVFSHGNLLKDAGHDESIENVNINSDSWEQMWMTYTYWKKGYTLYSPNKNIMFHNYDRVG